MARLGVDIRIVPELGNLIVFGLGYPIATQKSLLTPPFRDRCPLSQPFDKKPFASIFVRCKMNLY
jgi:hypothetical protein